MWPNKTFYNSSQEKPQARKTPNRNPTPKREPAETAGLMVNQYNKNFFSTEYFTEKWVDRGLWSFINYSVYTFSWTQVFSSILPFVWRLPQRQFPVWKCDEAWRNEQKKKKEADAWQWAITHHCDSPAASQGQTLRKLSSGDQITRVPKTDGLLRILLWSLRTNRCSLNLAYSDFGGPSVWLTLVRLFWVCVKGKY